MNKNSWEVVRVRQREAEIIRQVAQKYDERFIDALYRIVGYYRDNVLLGVEAQPPKAIAQQKTEETEEPEQEDLDFMNQFD